MEFNVIVCGLEEVIHNGVDFVRLDFQKYRAYQYNSTPAPYWASEATQNINLFYDTVELSSATWFSTSNTTHMAQNSHDDCYNQRTYYLRTSIPGDDCSQPWDSAEQLSKVEMVGNDLQINLIPFEEVDLCLLVYYPRGDISAFRKLKVAVCGLEKVLASNET